ncbi:MAG: hypothetical protein ACFE9T_10845 [Promethearchaeota archaeon]
MKRIYKIIIPIVSLILVTIVTLVILINTGIIFNNEPPVVPS